MGPHTIYPLDLPINLTLGFIRQRRFSSGEAGQGQTVRLVRLTRPEVIIAAQVVTDLKQAVALHSRIATEGIQLKDMTGSYQLPWRAALDSLLAGCKTEFEMLRLLA